MGSRVRRMCGDLLVSAGVLAAVIGVLVSIDARVREHVHAVVSGTWPVSVADAGAQLRDVGFTVFEAARSQSIEHAPLVIFAVVATVLLLALARS
ncbi:MAG: hypothetical protein HY655_09550 [Acidobacteria bacterium]|nr:hypothetical protein [Acidobacteriota bacterium]